MMFNFSKPAAVTRKVTVKQQQQQQKRPAQQPRSTTAIRPPNGASPAHPIPRTPSRTSAPLSRALSASRTPTAAAAAAGKGGTRRPAAPSRQVQSASRLETKRKASATPTVQFSSDDSSSSSDEEPAIARKRTKTSTSLEPDPKRRIWRDPASQADGGDTGADGPVPAMVHGYDLTVDGHEKDFYKVFEGEEEIPVVELRYPSASPSERFELVRPRESDGFKPLDEIIQTVEQVLTHYFPDALSEEYMNENTGFPRRIKRAIQHNSLADLRAVLGEYNALLDRAVADGTIAAVLNDMHTLPLPLVERILSQVYARTVSPRVSLLRAYQNGTDNVYGELLPRFCHEIFRETHLTSHSVFVDLGSGVGNVVLQAALETGAESWGIEMMPNPCQLARLQAAELQARSRLWGLNVGPIHLLEGDFLATPAIDAVLRRADVVLVNNQAFTSALNDSLSMKFLDLRDGCVVVSLKNFALANRRHDQDYRNILDVQTKEYYSDSVSWTDAGGTYFVAVKRPVASEEDRGGRRGRGR